jgi:hypothetical protein
VASLKKALAHGVASEKTTRWRCSDDQRCSDTNRKAQAAGGNAVPAERCARHGGGGAEAHATSAAVRLPASATEIR